MSEVKIENVSKQFGEINAVSNLSFTVNDGEFVVLLGPTGAGKTTTLRLIAGLEQADEGKIFIGNEDVTQAQPAKRDVAFVFQQYSLYPNYTVYNNLAFPLRSPLRSLSKDQIDKTVRDIAKTLHIEDKLKNKATHLSGGEMQRVALGRALVREPNIFLMDEPLSSLDAKLREELRLELKNIQVQLGATLLFVTHDHVEATTMADRIGIIKEGTLIQIDPPEKIYNDPNSVYVATKLGSPKINVIPSRLLNMELPANVEYTAFRPEKVSLNSKGTLDARIETIQNLGVEEIVSMSFMGEIIRAVVKPESISKSDKDIKITIRKDDMLFFDKESQRVYL
ncbi:MAG: ABC transporter ATP-binding protein [Desulfobacterales bacterium]|uniref:ABC transporter ATP-binding protein n=1 Tax=Candidatus Desulfacyla euxinica TaxID=2841693 RepID=A0A8J6T965_9DELT|nr:ABC transporter ATP-binding protein [Candidatus Desulfacyla euxinica]MBL6970513.1 ABC transporter ATP-binding protein [Desulfobacterales bacterium]